MYVVNSLRKCSFVVIVKMVFVQLQPQNRSSQTVLSSRQSRQKYVTTFVMYIHVPRNSEMRDDTK